MQARRSKLPPFARMGQLPVESSIRLTSRFPTRTTAKYGRPFFGAHTCASNRDQNYAQSRQQVASAQCVAFPARSNCQGREGSAQVAYRETVSVVDKGVQ